MGPSPDTPGGGLRFGIMCNGTSFPAWQADAIRQLLDIDGVTAGLLIVRAGGGTAPSRWARLADRPHLLWTLFNKGWVERRSRASRGVDMTEELAGVPTLPATVEPVGRFGERFTDDDVAVVRDHDLDFILRFGFGIIKGDILTAARHGVWSFHHGDERRYRGRPPGFWELVDGEPVVGSILQRLTERLDGGIVLHRGTFGTTRHSYVRTRDEAFLGSADWPSIVARQALTGDTTALEAGPSKTDAPVRHDPTNATVARFLARQALSFLRSQWVGLTGGAMWSVGIADAPIASFLEGATPAITWVGEQGAGRYLADPFGTIHEGKPVALVEDYDHATHRGVISFVPLTPGGRARTVIDAGVHASYPYLFEGEGSLWCMPETYQADELRLYRCLEFPDRWELASTVIGGMPVLDATVTGHEGRWWLFCTDQRRGSNTKLHVFHAATLTGPWVPHALNPVKTDIRSARPAGTPFVVDGVLYRPTQDGSESYGGGVTICRIDALTPTRFSESPVTTVRPPTKGRYRDGLHTLSALGDKTVVDGRRDTFVWPAFKRELFSRAKKLCPGGSK